MRAQVVNLSALLIFATVLLGNNIPFALSTCSYIIVACMLLLGFMLPPQNNHHVHLARHSQLFQEARLARQEHDYTQEQKTQIIKEKYLGVPDE